MSLTLETSGTPVVPSLWSLNWLHLKRKAINMAINSADIFFKEKLGGGVPWSLSPIGKCIFSPLIVLVLVLANR